MRWKNSRAISLSKARGGHREPWDKAKLERDQGLPGLLCISREVWRRMAVNHLLTAPGPLPFLPQETKGSVAVRVALGETQLVQEVRSFLIDNGVCLDSFSQVSCYCTQ